MAAATTKKSVDSFGLICKDKPQPLQAAVVLMFRIYWGIAAWDEENVSQKGKMG